jgi:hypothetical protein
MYTLSQQPKAHNGGGRAVSCALDDGEPIIPQAHAAHALEPTDRPLRS